MEKFLEYAFIFMIGSLGGWMMELLYRRFFSAKKWINPGFLVGPCLPIYGFGLCSLYLLTNLNYSFISNNKTINTIAMIVISTFGVTLIEYITGLIFIKGMKIKLWDYTSRPGNIQGIICPLFTFFWGLIIVIYYFIFNPKIVNGIDWLHQHWLFSFIIGIYFGVLIVDVIYSFDIATKIKNIAKDNKIIVYYESLKINIKEYLKELKLPTKFILPFKSKLSLKEHIDKYIENIKNKISNKN